MDRNRTAHRRITRSVWIFVTSENQLIVKICQLILEGGSKRFVELNYTLKFELMHRSNNTISLTIIVGDSETIAVLNQSFHCLVPFSATTIATAKNELSLSPCFGQAVTNYWTQLKSIVYEIPKQCYGNYFYPICEFYLNGTIM